MGIGIIGGQGHVVGHQHVGVADLLVDVDGFDEIHVAFVGIDFDEVVAMAANVAEMHVENLLARAEVADDVEDFDVGIFEIFGDGSLAKVQAVIGALLNSDELFESVDGAEHAMHALVALRRQAMRILHSLATGIT